MIMPDSIETRTQAATIVAAGGLIAFRTDTFYGLGVDPFNGAAIGKLKELKGREAHKPILIVLSDVHAAARFMVKQTEPFMKLAAHFWPGALTLVGQARADVPDELTAGTGTIGVRLPADDDVRALVRVCGGALTATSANLAGAPPARTAAEAARAFPHGLSLIVDGGPARTDKPSTVVDVTGDTPRLIREGMLVWREIEAALTTK
jgi:L-threonylcarbamoyladenylate synthase